MATFSVIVAGALVVSLFVAIFKKLYHSFFGCLQSKDIPSPAAYPILRHMPYFLDSVDDDKKLCAWAEAFKKEGIFKFDPLLGSEIICVFREEFLKKILVKNCTKYGRPTNLSKVFPKIAKGVFIVNGKEHAWQRKMLNPAFSFSSLMAFVEVFDANTNNLIKCWKDKAESSLSGVAEVDIHKDFSKLTLDVIGETAFGYNFNTLTTGENKISQSVELILSGKIGVVARVLRRYIPFYDMIPFPGNIKLKNAAKVANSVVTEIIKKKREMLSGGVDPNGDLSKDLLGKMILLQDEETGQQLSDEVIESQVFTFMVAGHETTSVALTWTFYLLAKHPDVQEKAREEAKTVLCSSNVVRSEHLEDLRYITAVLNESLRMYPPGAVFRREVLQDDEIGGYKIPKGANIIVPVCVMHHMEENWHYHNQFSPERFLIEGEKQPEVGNYKFMPFSNGPRNCIGRKFAVMEMKVIIAKLLTTFKFNLGPRQEPMHTKLQLTMKPNPKPVLRISPLED
ncbi:uncharacterized protein LOC135695975 [Rhopilema esculentum]|uniref:uncharacterized protein LOC135695975 n=1 Tax=Rhopilema esculentum TaxID=499914 RepID=UPI0031D11226